MNIKEILTAQISGISPKLLFYIAYLHNRGKLPNLNPPQNLSEILIRKVLDRELDSIAFLADKYAVRDYVKGRGLDDILPRLIGVWDNACDVDFNSLPEKFALKMNFGAGMNIICPDKSKIQEEEVKEQLEKWLESGKSGYAEYHYDLIPRKIICEEWIDDGSGCFPTDYKFMCINGKVHCVLVCHGRGSDEASFFPYDVVTWKPLQEYYKVKLHDTVPAPNNIKQMVEIAERLSEGMDFVRVDLYSNGTSVWFGEMTLTPSGCILHRWTDYAIEQMGGIYKKQSIE